MKSFRSTLTAWILVLAMAWTGIFSASGFCSSWIEKHPGGVFPPAAYRTQQIPLQGLIPSQGNSSLLTTTASNAPFYTYDSMVQLPLKRADAAHPSLGRHHPPKAIIFAYDDLHHLACEPTRLTGFGMDSADAKPEGQRRSKAAWSATIAALPRQIGENSLASYTYDNGNGRISRTSSIAGVVNQSFAFNNNDQIDGSGYAYDDNGSTTQGPDGSADVYSFDNMLIRRVNTGQGLTVDMVYSATGDRVSKTTNGITTNYLVDTNNHTGYAQVLEEPTRGIGGEMDNPQGWGEAPKPRAERLSQTDAAGNLEAVMVYGHDLISQDRTDGQGGFEMSFYSYDGLGSVRGLTDSIGTSLGQYHYDAYGTKIEDTVSVANPYLFAGERFDNDLGLYYLRARYLDTETGRFWSLDDFEGYPQESLSLHKYLYAHANPISGTDPSGNSLMTTINAGIAIANDMSRFLAARATLFVLKRPLLTTFLALVVNLVIPGEVHDSIMMSGLPGSQAPAAIRSGEIGILKRLQKMFFGNGAGGLGSRLKGELSNIIGRVGFENALKRLLKRGDKNVKPQIELPNGRRIDFLWNNVLIEAKTGAFDARAREQMKGMIQTKKAWGFIFMNKPSKNAVADIEAAGGFVTWFYE